MSRAKGLSIGQCTAIGERCSAIPLLKRHVISSLDGDWHCQVDPGDVGEVEGWHEPGSVRERWIPVPAPWQFALEDLRHYIGTVWYERSFAVPEAYRGRRITLVFVAVDYACKVWVNGEVAGDHVGGYSPFALDISHQVRFGQENTLTVKVTDPEWVDFNENNHWNVHTSGIWRSVWLEDRGTVYVADIHVIPDVDASRARMCIRLCGALERRRDLGLRVLVKGPDGRGFRVEERMTLAADGVPVDVVRQIDVAIDDPVLWDVDHPVLYEAEVTLVEGDGRVVDSASTEFGMRKIEIRGPQIYLNGKPIYLFGGMDLMHVGFNIAPEYRYPTDQEIRREIEVAKELGMNFIRKGGGCLEDPRYLYWADHLGMLLMLVPPAMHQTTEESLQRWFDEWRALIIRDRNHPSVLIWSAINESFGLYYDENWEVISGKVAREFIEQAYMEAKALDPTRPIIDNSDGHGLDRVNCDLDDGHYYYKLSQYENCRQAIGALRAYGKPYVITEFNPHIMLPHLDRFKEEWNGKPWWLEESTRLKALTRYEHSCVHPAGYEGRFHQWGLDEVYASFTDLMEKNGWLIYEAVKYQIEQIRKNPDISGYCYTDMYDNVGVHTGLVDYWRERKPWADAYAELQTLDLVFVDWSRLNFWTGDVFKGEVHVSHWSQRPLQGSRVRWWLEGFEIGGTIDTVTAANFDVQRVGDIRFAAPAVQAAQRARLHVVLEKDSEPISRNHLDIYIYPREYMTPTVEQMINVPLWQSLGSSRRRTHKAQSWKGMGWESESLTYRLGVAGYEVYAGLDRNIALAVATSIDDDVEAYLASGGTLLLMDPDLEVQRFLSRFGMKLAPETGGGCESQFVRKSTGMFRRVQFDNPLLWPFHKVFPRTALLGLKPEQHRDILAGVFGHYITYEVREDAKLHGVGATIAQMRYGRGRLLVTTWDLFRNAAPLYNRDPVAIMALQDLVEYALGPFEPETVLVPET